MPPDQKTRRIQYLWFLAPSGHGKTTAVRECTGNEDHILRERLGLANRRVILCIESLNRDNKYDDLLPVLQSRYRNLEVETCILIDGQWPDMELGTVLKWRNEVNADHKIVFLNCDLAEAARRCREGRGERDWEKHYAIEEARSHFRNMVENYVIKLKEENLPVIVIDSTDRQYRLGKWEDIENTLRQLA